MDGESRIEQFCQLDDIGHHEHVGAVSEYGMAFVIHQPRHKEARQGKAIAAVRQPLGIERTDGDGAAGVLNYARTKNVPANGLTRIIARK